MSKLDLVTTLANASSAILVSGGNVRTERTAVQLAGDSALFWKRLIHQASRHGRNSGA